MNDDGPVWAVNRADPSHKVYFPGRANAERWLNNRDPADWDVTPIADDELRRLWRERRG